MRIRAHVRRIAALPRIIVWRYSPGEIALAAHQSNPAGIESTQVSR
jgi:hypothetical protein